MLAPAKEGGVGWGWGRVGVGVGGCSPRNHASCGAWGIIALPHLCILPGQGTSSGMKFSMGCSKPCCPAHPDLLSLHRSCTHRRQRHRRQAPHQSCRWRRSSGSSRCSPACARGWRGSQSRPRCPTTWRAGPAANRGSTPLQGVVGRRGQQPRCRIAGAGVGVRVLGFACAIRAHGGLAHMLPTHPRLAGSNVHLCTHWPAPGST